MKTKARSRDFCIGIRVGVALLCAVLLLPGDTVLAARWQEPQAAAAGEQQAAKIPADQLDSLVAPIALYPDPMLAQVLAASTYPLEIIQLHQWLTKNKDLKDKALADAVAKQPWDPSVQALAGLPDVVKRLADDIQWTTELGNAFLAQQNDVMEAVQRMRAKAKEKGNLKSNEQQKVETKVVESKQVIVIEQANPEVVYVPSYNPTVVYGPPAYPYPPVYYPPPGYYAAGMAISFGVGVAMGAMWSGGWCCNSSWGGNNNVTINNNNNFNRNSNIQGGNRVSGGAGGGNWQHNPKHRGGTPYSNRQTANKFGGTTRGSSVADRQANARRNASDRGQGNRGGVGDNRGGRGGVGDNRGGVGDNRGDRGGVGDNRGGAGDNRGDRGGDRGGGAGDRGGNRGGGGGDRVGDRSTSRSGGSRGMSSGGMSGSSARASSSRGSSSMGSRGGSRGGGGGRRR